MRKKKKITLTYLGRCFSGKDCLQFPKPGPSHGVECPNPCVEMCPNHCADSVEKRLTRAPILSSRCSNPCVKSIPKKRLNHASTVINLAPRAANIVSVNDS